MRNKVTPPFVSPNNSAQPGLLNLQVSGVGKVLKKVEGSVFFQNLQIT